MKYFRHINTVLDWKELLRNPALHWRRGYSARALAFCWMEANGFPACIEGAFRGSGLPIFQDIGIIAAFPEYSVGLPRGGRGVLPQNDIFIIAKDNISKELISITVEGKVKEPFGSNNITVSKWLQNGHNPQRLDVLLNELNLNIQDVQNIRYQLLHRTASAILEAKSYNACNALMLVHSFSQRHERFMDFVAFASLFGIEIEANTDTISFAAKINNINLFLGWVTGEEQYLHR